jgi:hypothetical protein
MQSTATINKQYRPETKLASSTFKIKKMKRPSLLNGTGCMDECMQPGRA